MKAQKINCRREILSPGSARAATIKLMKKLRPSAGYRDTCSFQTATLIP
ncbi:MAG: hypothetical protein WCS31_16985 [Verrucomicrobiae bacterium]